MTSFHIVSLIGFVAFVLASTPAFTQDKIVQTSGQVLEGKIISADPNGVTIELKTGSIKIPATQIASIEMAPPPAFTQAKQASKPAEMISNLAPLIEKFKGMKADWVVDAMGLLADAYAAQDKLNESQLIYAEMEKLYPGSKFLIKAKVGAAKLALRNGQIDEAISLLTPLIEEANQTISPTAEDGRLFGEAFLVRGQALEKKGKLPEALESYLTIETTFYHNSDVVKNAQERAKQLRQNNPTLIVN